MTAGVGLSLAPAVDFERLWPTSITRRRRRCSPRRSAAMTAELTLTGNPSSLHSRRTPCSPGRRGVPRDASPPFWVPGPSEIVLTAGGTEADNLAVKGLFWSRRAADPRRIRVLASAVEHHAVLDPVAWLGDHEGAIVEWLPVDGSAACTRTPSRPRLDRNPDGRRPRHRDVGQQRDRHGRSRCREIVELAHELRRPRALRRRPGGRPAPRRLRRLRPGRDDRDRAQARWPVRASAPSCSGAG